MLRCPECGTSIPTDAIRCPECSWSALSRNPALEWLEWGGGVGLLVGMGAGLVGGLIVVAVESAPDRVIALFVGPPVGAMCGAVIGAMAALLWMSLVRPVLMALFAS